MLDIAHISINDCVIVTQSEFDRLLEKKRTYLQVKMEIMRAEFELKEKRAWDEIT